MKLINLVTLLLVGVLIPFTGRAESEVVDHSMWDSLLTEYVNHDGNVDYARWKKADSRTLNRYLARMGGVDTESLGRDEKLAFWINVYNALTVRGILEFYPLESIKEKVGRFGGFNIWDDYMVLLKGKEYSLNHIEHKILRVMGDPRIHFAIVCASRGCPRLRNEAYAGVTVDTQLQDNALDFFRRVQNFRADPARATVHLSSILKWFGEDFGPDEAALRARIVAWIEDPDARALIEQETVKVRYLDYDWTLNKQ
ncbi:MAG: DUF547 domain-containing protein [Verrucomicrobia bacterium]|nr:DUF547 domain-containing protein [Verrucomicrobiota bacterium]MDA1087195.1 DUF547 domain-containing protein [Verrucomicrobiota bacterium]